MTGLEVVTARVDAVVVAYNSAATLRGCVSPLVDAPGVHVIVVDNASPDDSLGAVDGLPLTIVRAHGNDGFAAGCNLGTAHGVAPYVLLLNPDARLERADLAALVAVLDGHPEIGIVGPRTVDMDGRLSPSQRRFPHRTSTFAQALFLHRLWPLAPWSDEVIRDVTAYDTPGAPDWLSGACLLIRRTALEAVGGLDEGFFLYCEDTDLCACVRKAGWTVRYDPAAGARHVGGHSGARETLLGVLAQSRVHYARKHEGRTAAAVEAAGVALGHTTHALASIARPASRRGHVAALRALAHNGADRHEAEPARDPAARFRGGVSLRYAAITPARNEAGNLPRLAAALAAQTLPPERWVIVDDGSDDETPDLLEALCERHAWISVLSGETGGVLAAGRREGRDLEGFRTGARALTEPVDVVIKLDADVDFEPDYCERLLEHFQADPSLGIASGTCYEVEGGAWVRRTKTDTTVWGATRAYRWAVLPDVYALEPRMGWDGLDEVRVQLRGLRTEAFVDLPFRHNRPEGGRERSTLHQGAALGRASWYMGYRPTYLALRAFYRGRRQPAALGMLWGYGAAALSGTPRCPDSRVVAAVRERQRLRVALRRGAPAS